MTFGPPSLIYKAFYTKPVLSCSLHHHSLLSDKFRLPDLTDSVRWHLACASLSRYLCWYYKGPATCYGAIFMTQTREQHCVTVLGKWQLIGIS